MGGALWSSSQDPAACSHESLGWAPRSSLSCSGNLLPSSQVPVCGRQGRHAQEELRWSFLPACLLEIRAKGKTSWRAFTASRYLLLFDVRRCDLEADNLGLTPGSASHVRVIVATLFAFLCPASSSVNLLRAHEGLCGPRQPSRPSEDNLAPLPLPPSLLPSLSPSPAPSHPPPPHTRRGLSLSLWLGNPKRPTAWCPVLPYLTPSSKLSSTFSGKASLRVTPSSAMLWYSACTL